MDVEDVVVFVKIVYGCGFEISISLLAFKNTFIRGTEYAAEHGVPIILAEIASHMRTTFLLKTSVEESSGKTRDEETGCLQIMNTYTHYTYPQTHQTNSGEELSDKSSLTA